ncbi:amino acid permease [Yinghuangia soli]|uniref:Amino acid permease n=1 Tax=Yinghuangia soli TaxID=2908204 RepID=A0AA41PWR8_9ACTN|nr:amino acid permease [Yinghuangia soli]MCF2526269.1 amino acid permease [Yinghuangia soli]
MTISDPGTEAEPGPDPDPDSDSGRPRPEGPRPARGSLGLLACTALVIGNMIGSGVFLLPGTLAPYGGLAIVAWCFTCAGALLLALVFGRFARLQPHTGGPYAYVERTFGRFTGFMIGWGYWIAVWVGNAAIAIAAVGYLAYFVPALEGRALSSALVAVALSWAATYLNVRGVKDAGFVAILTTALKLIPLVGIAVVGLFFLDRGAVPEFNPTGGSAFQGITAAAALTLWAFIGMESATVPAGDVKDPRRTIPRSTILGVSVASAVYVLSTFVVMTLVPAGQLESSSAPFADAAEVIVGKAGGSIVAAGGLIACLGAMSGWVMLQGQVPMALARDGLFPKRFGAVNRHGSPAYGLVFSNVLVTVLILMTANSGLAGQFKEIILIATLSSLIPYGMTALALLKVMRADRSQFPGSAFAKYTAIAVLAAAYSAWAIYGSGWETVWKGLAALVLGLPVYFWLRRRGDGPDAWQADRTERPARAGTAP